MRALAQAGIGYAEFRVGDVGKAADRLVAGYGFRIHQGFRDAEPGTLLVHGGVRLLLRPGGAPGGRGAAYLDRHGDGVAALAVVCADPRAAVAEAVAGGARTVPGEESVIEVFDDFGLRLIAPDDPALAPLEEAAGDGPEPPEGRFETIDHLALCVPAGTLASIVGFCERVLGLRRVFGEFIEVGEQAMDSIVVQSDSGAITFTFLEPCPDRRPGQIDAFLAAHGGPGVQHIALRTGDIAAAVRVLGSREVEFLSTPGAYYDELGRRFAPTEIPAEVLRELDVLVDQDHGGQLYQIFTRSTHPRRTFFFELIERRGAGTFGTANIKALYEAVERQTLAAGH